MTDDEIYIAQGRARADAKKLKAELATLRLFFDGYIKKLEDMKLIITRFTEDPSGKGADGYTKIDHLNRWQRGLSAGDFFEKSAEFLEKTGKLRKLEEQIKDFE